MNREEIIRQNQELLAAVIVETADFYRRRLDEYATEQSQAEIHRDQIPIWLESCGNTVPVEFVLSHEPLAQQQTGRSPVRTEPLAFSEFDRVAYLADHPETD